MKYYITIRSVACENTAFHKAAAANFADFDELIACDCVETYEHKYETGVKLIVPEMYGLASFTTCKRKYVPMREEHTHGVEISVDSTSTDFLAFEHQGDYYEADLRYAKRRLDTKMDHVILGADRDSEDELAEYTTYFDEAVFKFHKALARYRKYKNLTKIFK